MAAPIRFDGRVVLVTGAGGGLGREHALAFAERGASVVVNDLGGDRKGGGASASPADKVVDEIKSKGGKAVANYDSVEDGEKLIQTALDNFGRIDIVVNNAGILRDRSFARISDGDWDLIHRVHLRGTFMVSRAAWPHMKKQNFGRIINTTSGAGIYGNFGQANYSAAKLGILGLSNTLAIEGKKNNIFVNTIAPIAGSRLTEDVIPPEVFEMLRPEFVSPLVTYLSSETCEESGGLFEVGGGWVSKLQWQRGDGALVRRKGQPMTPEDVRDNWDKITDFSNSTNPQTLHDQTMAMMKAAQSIDATESQSTPGGHTGGPVANEDNPVIPDVAKAHTAPPISFTYDSKEVILYALGTGVSTSQPDFLKFLFEGNEDFCVLPSFGVIPAFKALFIFDNPGLAINPVKILHGEQYLELYKPFPTEGVLTTTSKVVDVIDKGSGAVILLNAETTDSSGEKVAFNQFSIFAVGYGNFGGARNSEHTIAPGKTPSRAPDATIQEKTTIDQAALYRLSGDRNPLHIDPAFAAMGGFSTPILHGLCSFGYATRHVMKQYCNNDVTKVKAIKVRFAKPVLPGETIQTDMWKEGTRIHFQCKVVESGNLCLSGAYVDLNTGAESAKQETAAPALASDLVFDELSKRLKDNPAIAKKINAVYQWSIKSGNDVAATWTMDLKKDLSIYRGPPKSGKAECSLTLSDDDMVSLVSGQLDAQNAFMSGKLKIAGNIMLSQKLQHLFQEQSKL